VSKNIHQIAILRFGSTLFLVVGLTVGSSLLTACGSGSNGNSSGSSPSNLVGTPGTQFGPTSIARGTRIYKTDALVYIGDGAWSAEIPGIEKVLTDHGATYDAVSSAQLNAKTLDELSQYGTIVWPGGYGNVQTSSLTSATRTKLRQVVQERGVSWIGFCAGAFVAVAPAPPAGRDPVYGFGIVNAPVMGYYFLEDEFVKQGKESQDWAMTMETFADGSKRDLLWYGGPVTPSGANTVVAKYPNGDAAISQVWSGNGLVILSAVHPAAPPSVAASFGLNDSDGADYDLAWRMLEAAIKQKDLPTF
jgi:hypothetical protein